MGPVSEPVVLVTGFGTFPGVAHNPTAALARAVDGAWVSGHRVRGLVLPVEYRRGPATAIEAARALGARAVLGTGVATLRARPCWELRGVRWSSGAADAAGEVATGLRGPDELRSGFAPARAAAFGAVPSTDAGAYVCNAWLYGVTAALDVPVGFLHVPAEGIPAHRFLTALAALLAPEGG